MIANVREKLRLIESLESVDVVVALVRSIENVGNIRNIERGVEGSLWVARVMMIGISST